MLVVVAAAAAAKWTFSTLGCQLKSNAACSRWQFALVIVVKMGEVFYFKARGVKKRCFSFYGVKE